MKAPRVSKKTWEGRQPLGVLRNALPSYWLCLRDDGALWIMWDKTVGESTGAQVCLGIISAETMTKLREAKTPLLLTA